MQDRPAPSQSLFAAHPRVFEANRYVYPVLSRRARGISIGLNLTPDKSCNFRCVYCQVDRSQPGAQTPLDLQCLRNELQQVVELVVSGRLYLETRFRETPPSLRRLNDLALSGDGEPTASAAFEEVVSLCADVLRARNLPEVRLVLITNGSLLHRRRVRRALKVLDAANGEIWAKLDAGTEACFRHVARTQVAWQRILDNLSQAARVRPIVVQSLFMRIHGQPPSPGEQQAYCQQLEQIVAAGGRIKLVQVHTIARPPAEPWVTALSAGELNALADLVRHTTGLPVEVFTPAG